MPARIVSSRCARGGARATRSNAAVGYPTDIFAIKNRGNPAWGINRGAAMELGCNYLLLCDNLLDPTHVAWVHQSSFATAATKDTPPVGHEHG